MSGQETPIVGWDAPPPPAPSWTTGPEPDPSLYVESELFVAGALSTMPPFDQHHPAWCLPFARQALDALGQWVPTDDAGDGA